MNQQERILKKAEKEIGICRANGSRAWGKTFSSAFKMAVKFTLENLWISVEKALPELVDKRSGQSEVVYGMSDHDNVYVVYYDYSNDTWYHHNYYGYDPKIYSKITHWMPIPKLNK